MVKIRQRAPSTVGLLEPAAPPWAQRFLLRLLDYFAPLTPLNPMQLWYADKADLPPAADWNGCLVAVPDQNCLAVSKGGVWLKVATGGPV